MPKTVKVLAMPFMAKCVSCGYVLWANTSAFLKMLMKQHDSESHDTMDSEDFDFCTWVITKINSYAYAQISMASKSPAFWKAIRTSPKTL
jgi:hypothetical protein